jgi:TolB protein
MVERIQIIIMKYNKPFALMMAASIFVSGLQPKFKPPTGKIAYARDEKELRLVNADGSGDHQLWTHKDAQPYSGIYDVAWSPDGTQLAFSSGHAGATSLFHADIYLIRPDGSGFCKLTNPPAADAYSQYPKGNVVVTVRNMSFAFQTSNATAGTFFVYVAGAAAPQFVTIPPGGTKTLTFTSVADFGKKAQAIVAIYGNYRWFQAGADVQAGKTVKAPEFSISGDGIQYFGAFHPVWRNDGSEISYRTGTCTIDRVPLDAPQGEFFFKPMFGGKPPFGACNWDWGPTPALKDQIIYTENSTESAIFLMNEGGTHPGKKLTNYSEIEYQLLHDLHWLPDGSGIVYSTTTLMRNASNIFRYDLKTKQTTQLTKFENEFAKKFNVSPDGEWIVYERSKEYDDSAKSDLWIQRINGSEAKLLVKNAYSPSWGR